MAISKYEIFIAVVELGNLTRASEKLNITQSGVSHAISSLETEFGLTLLNRDRSGISLTSNGERLIKYMREVLKWNYQLHQEVASIKGLEIGTVRIGTFTSVSTRWMPIIIKEFIEKYPSIEIELLEGNYDDINHWISSGSVDFGFVTLPTSKPFEIIPLKKDRMLCILSRNHLLASQNVITFEQIKEEPFIMPKWGSDNDVIRVLKENKVSPKIKYEVMEDETVIAMVHNGLGISILPEMVLLRVPGKVTAVHLENHSYRTIGIAATSLKELSPAAQKFLKFVQAWLEKEKLLDFK